MQRAFTLMELMVVVGIMAFLGLASANGYNALKRGMAERGAVDAVSAFLKAAKERAMVDRVPTVVYCCNRKLRDATMDDNAVVVGEAVAVRRAGRITRKSGQYLYDEFGDLERAYDIPDDASALANRKGFRLWQMDDRTISAAKYSIVSDGIFKDDGQGIGVSFLPLADGDASNISSNNDIQVCAFYEKSSHGSQWKVGTAYGLEFQTLRLPEGFIFESTPPSQTGQPDYKTPIYFDPEKISPQSGDETIDLYVCMPGTDGNQKMHHKAGTASSKE